MKYLITFNRGQSETLKLKSTPRINEKIKFNEKLYLVKDIINSESEIEIQVQEILNDKQVAVSYS